MNLYSILFIQIFFISCQGLSNYTILPIGSIPCPDQESSCPDGETCCQLESGDYGCCPLPQAVCCSDHIHCCPNGYTCDVEHSRCQKGFEDVLCPGGEMSCADGETCCQLESGDYGCCPLPDAVCCSDNSHCCPNGYRCDIKENKCEKGKSIPWFKKKAANRQNIPLKLFSWNESLSIIRCPDDKSICPEDTTCCEMKNGSYGCCPYKDGSCCSDQIHCCAEGYSCDQSGSRCIRHFHSMELFKINNEQICPDGLTKCSLSSTCCPNNDLTYSCCPYAKGVCCGSNGSECCPFRYICDEQHLTCQLNKSKSNEDKQINRCGSSNVICGLNEKCCEQRGLNNQQYGCCAFSNGVCCEDGLHCCPANTTCHLKSGGCIPTNKVFF